MTQRTYHTTQVHLFPESSIRAAQPMGSDGRFAILRIDDAAVDIYLTDVETCDRLIEVAREVRAMLEGDARG